MISDAAIRSALRNHWVTTLICDHVNKTDRVVCACSEWLSEPHPTVGAAIDAWVEHVMIAVAETDANALDNTGLVSGVSSAPNHQPHAVSQAAAFVAWAMREGPWEGGDLDGGALQDKAEELGLIIKTTYNPDIHGSCDYGSEPGDDWFVLHPDIEAAARLPAPPSPAKTGGDRG